ncbi:hypothetical protein N657DRAFT_566711 [Parathielavia appendiculata]|uniref:Uncharacterized protein n=1 Tax=Parathielavia appendiculata TaxID=2587402 RepID=A0AAN6Z735_9PEZI|nr:hypothetical protein N657DRAFT_566711 [Parathielavia appendiculata]
MATPVNPFRTPIDRGKRRTLQEIAAAAKGSNAFKAFHRQSNQPITGHAKVAKWLCDQGDPVQVREPNTRPSSRRSAFIILDDDDEAPGQRPHSLLPHAGAVAKLSPQVPHTPLSSRHFTSKGLKRNVSDLDDSEDVIYVRTSPAPSTPRRPPTTEAVVDLTNSNRPTRQTSLLGHQDDDVIIIDPPAAEIRPQLRQLLGRPRGAAEVQPRKRRKRAHAGLVPARGILEGPRVAISPERMATPEADMIEASTSLRSVESVTHFFTLATEMRDKIYRHLLVSAKPIVVRRLWQELCRPTSRRGLRGDDVNSSPLDPRILIVCRRTAEEGTRILYSENTFLYMLRDPDVVENTGNGVVRRSERGKNRKEEERSSRNVINLKKYGHLIRHMAIELESNRTEISYEKLMSAALETLVPDAPGSPRLPSPPRPPCGPIHLHTLTITISPLFITQRAARTAGLGNQDAVIHEGRFLSMVGFFSRGSPVLKALHRVNVDFLRIKVIVNSNIKDGRAGDTASPWVDLTEDEVDGDDEDDDAEDSDESDTSSEYRPKKWHFETTIDLRCLPPHLEELSRGSQLWANDALIQEKRRQQGAEAEEKLVSLRRHMEHACLDPEMALREKFWEETSAAERRRRAQRAKEERRFDADAYYVEDEGGDGDDGRTARGMKSLIISIDRVGDELRAYRP